MAFLYFIVMLGGIILLHEFGHFIFAKLFGVYVYEFALGMGPTLFKWEGKETKYSIRLLPLGGYCAMAGEEANDEAQGIPENRLYSGLSGIKKIIILAAGPLMNFILAWFLFVGIYLGLGEIVDPPLPYINGVIEESPAQAAGFEFGDKIVKITFSDGSDIEPNDFYDIIQAISAHHDEAVYTVERAGELKDITVTPQYVEEEDRYIIGITMPEANVRKLTIGECFTAGTEYFTDAVSLLFEVIGQLFHGIGLDTLSGPIGIYTATAEQIEYGFVSYLSLVGLLSLNIGIMNLIPVPMFDGGRILLTAIEMIIGKRLPKKLENALMLGSLGLVLLLFVYSTANDIIRLL
ncbi:MAG: site-2 protease family protein [Erysipelotrichaceae bacterium]|nr:site-2 protease family protein [Erysipelotrichaceae bacterium]